MRCVPACRGPVLSTPEQPSEGVSIQPSFSSKFASDLIAFAAERGADRAALTKMTNLPPAARDREDIRIPCTTMAKVWSSAMDQTGDEHIAMNLGVSRLLGANRTTSLIMEASSTVLEAFQLAVRYSVLIADVMSVKLGEIDDVVYLEFDPKPVWREQPVAVQLDCLGITYVSAVASLQRLIGTEQPPSMLTIAFPAPSSAATWFDIFDRPVDFGAASHRIGFPADLKSAAVITRDPGLKDAIRRYADEIRAGLAGESPVVRDVMTAIIEGMTPQPPSLSAVAGTLGMSSRSLQRILSAEGHTYRELVDTARMELSERHLRAGNRSVDEVARLAGYADTSSFVRAFKRRTGMPPRQFSHGRQ